MRVFSLKLKIRVGVAYGVGYYIIELKTASVFRRPLFILLICFKAKKRRFGDGRLEV